MQVKLGPELEALLTRSNEVELFQNDPDAMADLQRRIDQALAAAKLSDMEFPTSCRFDLHKENSYRLRLKIKWKGPIPAALEIRIVNEQLWELEVVRDES